ncbi:AAA family ATPase [Sorangium sp. So ce1036]|uniref:AAA family ATPase n=1 Tax=Sorangium sp. So ce1036 TaxID=3133328 RepID=UPI003F11E544
MRPIPIGIDDFRLLREQGMEYVDKTHLVRDVLDKGAQVLLLPRPRRFGKTLNLSTLRCFFEKRDEDVSSLFADLSIWQAGEAYRAHFQRYPVVFLTFKDVRFATFERCLDGIRKKLAALFEEHRAVLDAATASEAEGRRYREILDGTASYATCADALLDLARLLHRHHGERVVILLDEYDAPIHAGHANGYVKEVLEFFRAFLTAGLKGNPHLFKAVLTGILRIAQESIFSGLNNLAVYTLLRPDFATSFGFTEPEVEALLDRAGRRDRLATVRSWCNGYAFGGTVVYNPWSILNYIDSPEPEPRPYWVSTSANDLVREVLVRHASQVQKDIEALLEGSGVERRLDENVVLSDLGSRADALFGLLTFSGYLKAEKRSLGLDEEPHYRLSIPNREVRQVYTSTFREWMSERLGGESDVDRLKQALLSGNAESLEEELQRFTQNVLSYHDTALRPEQVYHAFVIGLLATLEPEHEVRSNRESGRGRPDVTIRPRQAGKPGAVLELKVAKPVKKTLDQALAEGVSQIRDRGYAAELGASGASPVHAFAVAFDGKTVRVQAV